MVIKLFTSALLVFFLAACSTTPKDTADSSGSGSSSSSSDVSSSEEGTITETSPESASIAPGSQEDLIVNVGDRVFFNYDSSDLDSDAQELLQDQVAWLKQYSNVSVIVEGHCDERGTREYNLALGEQRAKTVAELLIINWVSSSKISTVSYGEEKPAASGSNENSWSKNRRALVKTF